MKKPSKIAKVMREFKEGKLHSGKDPKGPKKSTEGQEQQAGYRHRLVRGRNG
jgi:hypothetical protein